MAQLKITYTKSTIGYSKDQKATVKSLGLRKLRQSVIHNDTLAIRGMAFKVRHLVTMEEIAESTPTAGLPRTYDAPAGLPRTYDAPAPSGTDRSAGGEEAL
jgi:large subunit ribosomal protein L30